MIISIKKLKLILLFLPLALVCLSGRGLALEKVTLQLRWDHAFQFAGYYAAKWQGYYNQAGLDVEIKSALESKTKILRAVTEVAEGRAEFGIGATDVLLARSKDVPLVILAAIFQKSAAGFYFKADTPLNSLADLPKLRVARQVDSLIDLEFQAMLKSEGIDPKLIKPYPHQGGLDHLISGQIDVMPGYSISMDYSLNNLNISFKSLSPWRYGIDFYGDSLFTHERVIESNPEIVAKFKEASLLGWKYALDHPDEIANRIATELTRKAVREDLAAYNKSQIKGVKELMLYPLVDIGHINPNRWRRMFDHLSKLGIVKGTLDIKEFIYDPIQMKKESAERFQSIMYITMGGIICLVGVVLVWIFSLRRTVAMRTANLSEVNKKLENEIHEREQAEEILIRSERKQNSMISNISDVIGILSADGITIYKSPNIKKYFGWDPEDLLGSSAFETVHPHDLERTQKVFMEVLQIKSSAITVEFNYLCKNGDSLPVELIAINQLDNPNINGILINYRDISERRQSENQIKASLKEKETLLHEIHHRVKNNMAVVASLLKLQANDIEDERIKEILKESQNRVYAMSAVHETLHGSENLSAIDLKTYLSKVTSSIFQTYSVTPDKVKLKTDIEEIPISIDQANPIGLVINELISNSLKYAFPEDRKGEIKVSMKKLDKELELAVADDGIGIPDGLDWKTVDSLGLKLVRTLVENQLDGSIDMESKNGTKFTIKFNIEA